ncbi:MAG: hypothetical protein GIX02_08755 [Candidatus Eremiobacteraeota bacterium]|nr:hypothetical protein [Candidatus Eremiobacteraeota bacterium]
MSTTASLTNETLSIGANATGTWGWVSGSNEPGGTSWPGATYTITLNVTVANPALSISTVKIYRVDANGGPNAYGLALVGQTNAVESLANVGTLQFTITGAAQTANVGDRLAVKVFIKNSSSTVQSFSYDAGAGAVSELIATPAFALSPSPSPSPSLPPTTTPIKHVVIIIQENRSFNNLFMNFPGALTATQGTMSNGTVVALKPQPLEAVPDLGHGHKAWESAYDSGKMDGFNNEGGFITTQGPTYPYSYVPQSEIAPYWQLASQYTLADHFFQSNTGPSYPAHQYLIAGTSDLAAMNPNYGRIWGCDSPVGTTVQQLDNNGNLIPGPFPCYDYTTIADSLDQAGLKWHYYAAAPTHVFSAYDAVRHIRNSTYWSQDVIAPASQFLTDVGNGQLAEVTWITPYYRTSDHPGNGTNGGPAWVASVVDAVGASKFWSSTAIFITWDDWGGWFDPVTPPQLDLMGLGFRVPLIVVSPYAKPAYVSHTQHEFASILRFTEENFSLPQLGTTDVRADNLADCFNFAASPLPFKRVSGSLPTSVLRQQEAGSKPDDDY